jgi:hypothetical protein
MSLTPEEKSEQESYEKVGYSGSDHGRLHELNVKENEDKSDAELKREVDRRGSGCKADHTLESRGINYSPWD